MSASAPEWVTADFAEGNSQWREHGWLERTPEGFVLQVMKTAPNGVRTPNGTRVFPLKGRTVTLYYTDWARPPVTIKEDWKP